MVARSFSSLALGAHSANLRMMSDLMELTTELKQLLVTKLRLEDVTPDSISDDELLLRGPMELDSIDVLELVLAVEDRYGVVIDDKKTGQGAFQSIATLAAYIQEHRSAPSDPESTSA